MISFEICETTASLQYVAHVTSQCGFSEESTNCSLPHTGAHRYLRMITVIDLVERKAILPTLANMANFTVLDSRPRIVYHNKHYILRRHCTKLSTYCISMNGDYKIGHICPHFRHKDQKSLDHTPTTICSNLLSCV